MTTILMMMELTMGMTGFADYLHGLLTTCTLLRTKDFGPSTEYSVIE